MMKTKTRVKTEKWPQLDRRLTATDEEGDVVGADVEVAEVGGEVPVEEMEALAIVRTKTRTRTRLTGAEGTKSYRVSVNLKADCHHLYPLTYTLNMFAYFAWLDCDIERT